MRAAFSDRVERARVNAGPRFTSSRGDPFGLFELRTNAGERLRVLASPGSDEIPWEHVSVSTPTRCPTWEEMAWVKSLFFDDEEAVVQFHPPRAHYVNYHPYCLHLWRPLGVELALPPTIAVGPVGESWVPR